MSWLLLIKRITPPLVKKKYFYSVKEKVNFRVHHHWSQLWARRIRYVLVFSNSTSLRYTLTLLFHLSKGLSSNFPPSHFFSFFLCQLFLFLPLHATWPVHCLLLAWSILIILMRFRKHTSSHCAIFSSIFETEHSCVIFLFWTQSNNMSPLICGR
jgi:hypothetical protein